MAGAQVSHTSKSSRRHRDVHKCPPSSRLLRDCICRTCDLEDTLLLCTWNLKATSLLRLCRFCYPFLSAEPLVLPLDNTCIHSHLHMHTNVHVTDGNEIRAVCHVAPTKDLCGTIERVTCPIVSLGCALLDLSHCFVSAEGGKLSVSSPEQTLNRFFHFFSPSRLMFTPLPFHSSVVALKKPTRTRIFVRSSPKSTFVALSFISPLSSFLNVCR